MSPYWKYFLPGYVLALPNTLLGLVLGLIYRAHSWKWSNGCLETIGGTNTKGETRIFGKPGAQTHGWLIFYDTEHSREDWRLRTHERVHVVQAFLIQLLSIPILFVWFFLADLPWYLDAPILLVGSMPFGFLYVLFFFWFFTKNGFRNWMSAYRHNPFENQAYNNQSNSDAWGAEQLKVDHEA